MEEATLFFFSECMCNYCHTPVTPCHPRQGGREGKEGWWGGEGRGNEGKMSLVAAGVLVLGKREEDKEEREKQESLLIRRFLSVAVHWYPNDSRRDSDITRESDEETKQGGGCKWGKTGGRWQAQNGQVVLHRQDDRKQEKSGEREKKERHKPGDIPLNLLLFSSQTHTCLIWTECFPANSVVKVFQPNFKL